MTEDDVCDTDYVVCHLIRNCSSSIPFPLFLILGQDKECLSAMKFGAVDDVSNANILAQLPELIKCKLGQIHILVPIQLSFFLGHNHFPCLLWACLQHRFELHPEVGLCQARQSLRKILCLPRLHWCCHCTDIKKSTFLWCNGT